jgi:hypothetical protein
MIGGNILIPIAKKNYQQMPNSYIKYKNTYFTYVSSYWLALEKKNMVRTWLCPATQCYAVSINKSHLEYLGRLGLAPWEQSYFAPNQIWWSNMSGNVVIVSTPVVNA